MRARCDDNADMRPALVDKRRKPHPVEFARHVDIRHQRGDFVRDARLFEERQGFVGAACLSCAKARLAENVGDGQTQKVVVLYKEDAARFLWCDAVSCPQIGRI